MWSKRRKTVLLLCATGVLVLVTALLLVTDLLIPYRSAKNTMDPDGVLHIVEQNDGALQVSWPAGENAQNYELQVLETDGGLLYSCSTEDCSAVLSALPADRELVLRVISGHTYSRFNRKGEQMLEATLVLAAPRVRNLNWQAEADIGTVTVDFDLAENDLCRIFISTGDGEPVLVEQVREGKLKIPFGAGEKYDIPAYDQPVRFSFQVERSGEHVACLGAITDGFTLTREDLLGTDLNVEQVYNGENSYTFTWNETKGAYYDVRLSDDGGETWETMAYIPVDRERTYTTPNLTAYTDYLVSIVAVGGQTIPDSEFAAVSETMELHTGPKLLYSTIWPLMDQKVYADAQAAQELGTAAAGSAWCVLGQEGKYLKIRFQEHDGYINGEYCMINLPEYLGNLCRYNITNSYDSIYKVHEYGIKKVTGTVITGYENIKVGDGEYLVPLLYPTAQKLMKAGLAAREQGYVLKIYDSYRPQVATNEIFMLTSSIMGDYVPARTYSGQSVNDLHKLEQKDEEGNGEAAADTDWSAADEEPQKLIYKSLMTNYGEYKLSAFLAPGISRHNYGIALDLTLEDADGNELTMQTSMHDLSWYSTIDRNNANANILYRIMTGAELRSISSEWWHFQDNDIYKRNFYLPLQNGVSWQCWTADRNGWRYRLADGSFYANCTQTIDDKSYTFDENGYLIP